MSFADCPIRWRRVCMYFGQSPNLDGSVTDTKKLNKPITHISAATVSPNERMGITLQVPSSIVKSQSLPGGGAFTFLKSEIAVMVIKASPEESVISGREVAINTSAVGTKFKSETWK